MVMLLWSVLDKCLAPIRAVFTSLTFLLHLQVPLPSFAIHGLGEALCTPPLSLLPFSQETSWIMFSRVAYGLTEVCPMYTTEADAGSVFTPSRTPQSPFWHHTYPWNFSPTAQEKKQGAPEFDRPPGLSLRAVKLQGQSHLLKSVVDLGWGYSLPMHFLANAEAPATHSCQPQLPCSTQLTPLSFSLPRSCDRPS